VSTLPPGWAWATLGEIAEVLGGKTPKGLAQAAGGSIPFFKVGDMNAAEEARMTTARTYLSPDVVASMRLRLWPVGTVVFPKQGGAIATNKKRRLGVDGACDLNTMGVIPSDVVLSRLLLAWFETVDLSALSDGTVVAQIKPRRVAGLVFPLPPLNEQRRIVAAIEEHLSRLDAADASLTAALRRLVPLRSGVLTQAFDGGWPSAVVGDVAEVISGPAFKSASFGGPNDGVRLLRGENIEPGALRWRDVRTWPESLLAGYEHLYVETRDVILAMDRPVISTGLKLAPVRADDVPALLVQRVARIRPTDRVLTPFLHAALQVPRFIPHLLGDQTGTQLPHITLAGIRSFEIPLPPLSEQQRIVQEVEERLSRIDAMRASIERAQKRSKALRAAILERAFRGELVPQDPSDEPAEALLARIRAERDMSKAATGRRRKTVRR
jgi:type I restriction enzyme S subunit